VTDKYSRQINFENVANFRDLGGYKARGGRTLAWRRLFRSAELARMTRNDYDRLTGEFGVAAVIDLRSDVERERQGIGLITEAGVKYHTISFLADGGQQQAEARRYTDFSGMGEFYVYLAGKRNFGQRIVEALEIIAEPGNHPLVFHCAIGKDRTGILAGILLSALGVGDNDIIEDYAMSGPHMLVIVERLKSRPETADFANRFPEFALRADPDSMSMLLSSIKAEYGCAEAYLKAHGAEASLVERLEKALLV
jgi:protein-tyrosine phosphatase